MLTEELPGEYPDGTEDERLQRAQLEDLKDTIAEKLLERFGEYDSTAELIDTAVQNVGKKLEQQQASNHEHLEQRLDMLEERLLAVLERSAPPFPPFP